MPYGDDTEIVRLTNGVVEVHVSASFGPRVLRYGLVGGRNVFAQTPLLSTDTSLGRWRPVGGHRLWVAPERMPGSYAPDDRSVSVVRGSDQCARFDAHPDAAGIQKTLRIDVDRGGTRVVVTHVITNRTYWPAKLAAWAITVAATDGTVVIPQPAFRPHSEDFLAARQLVQWSYTNLSDSRWQLGSRLIALRPNPQTAEPQKIGAANAAGWCALLCADCTFVKHAEWIAGAEYPDLGCNTELFTAGDYLEMETLAPLRLLEPGESSEHVETWCLGPALEVDVNADRAFHIIQGWVGADPPESV